MAFTGEIYKHIVILDSNNKPVTRIIGGVTRRITIAGNDKFEVTKTVADNYDKLTIWNDGDGGLSDFDYLVCENMGAYAILLELVVDRAGTPKYASFPVAAYHVFDLTDDDMQTVVLTDGTITTMDQVDQINVKRNAADAVGDGEFYLGLFT